MQNRDIYLMISYTPRPTCPVCCPPLMSLTVAERVVEHFLQLIPISP